MKRSLHAQKLTGLAGMSCQSMEWLLLMRTLAWSCHLLGLGPDIDNSRLCFCSWEYNHMIGSLENHRLCRQDLKLSRSSPVSRRMTSIIFPTFTYDLLENISLIFWDAAVFWSNFIQSGSRQPSLPVTLKIRSPKAKVRNLKQWQVQ